jgi:hypothetical protein
MKNGREKAKEYPGVFYAVVTRISIRLIADVGSNRFFFLLALLFFLLTVCPMCSSLISYTALKFLWALPHLNPFPPHDLLTAPRGCFTLQIYFFRIYK